MDGQLADLKKVDRSLFPGSFAIRALRDSRYHSAAHAIAELIDNSVEADAEQIELLCMEHHKTVKSRTRRRVSQIAVLDNGIGMDARTLLDALKFGGGTRHNANRGIGKYGMGLPTSSMSQCKKVDVWTWQNGLDSAWHSSIDVDTIEQNKHLVPLPDRMPIPETWRIAGSNEIYQHRSGTLVVWSKLDKIQWKTAPAIIRNTSLEVGRIHRYFINTDRVRILAASFLENRPTERQETPFVANDPLYLMHSTSTPKPWNSEPMFKKWFKKDHNITVDGKEETIEVKYSIVNPEALETDRVTRYPGLEAHGQHAKHNIGVSVVREEREIVLETAFRREGGSSENPENRWWGCEVHFHRSCDELFGLDHNKQMVAKFTQAAKSLADEDRSKDDVIDERGIEEDFIHNLASEIHDETRRMMRQIKQMYAKRRDPQNGGGIRSPAKKAVKTATDADRDGIASGSEEPTETDKDRKRIPAEEREAAHKERFIKSGQTEEDAQQLAKMLVKDDLSYHFNPELLDGYRMFNVRSYQGVLQINLNTDHPIYDLIKHIEKDDLDESDPAFQASVAIRLLLSSWARMEDRTMPDDERKHIQHIAEQWGHDAYKHINQLRERDD